MIMKKLFLLFTIVIAFLLISGQVYANLLNNGSFETPIVTDHGGSWQLFNGSSFPYWESASDIELQTYSLYGPAADGFQYAELDSNANDGDEDFGNEYLIQFFTVTADSTYKYSFAFSPRPSRVENVIEYGIVNLMSEDSDWASHGTLSADGSNLSSTNWTYHSFDFTASAGDQLLIAFRDAGADDSYGTLLDDVSVDPVPEPATMLLLGSGLLGLVGFRRKFKR